MSELTDEEQKFFETGGEAETTPKEETVKTEPEVKDEQKEGQKEERWTIAG